MSRLYQKYLYLLEDVVKKKLPFVRTYWLHRKTQVNLFNRNFPQFLNNKMYLETPRLFYIRVYQKSFRCFRVLYCKTSMLKKKKKKTILWGSPASSCTSLHCTKKWGSVVTTESNAADGCWGCPIFVLGPGVRARVPRVKPDLVSNPVSVGRQG